MSRNEHIPTLTFIQLDIVLSSLSVSFIDVTLYEY